MSQEGTFALTLGGIVFVLTVIWGGPFIEILKRLKIGKQIRIDGPQTHLTKLGTPTMGGLMIVVPIVIITAVMNLVNLVRTVIGRSALVPLFVLIAFAALGAFDDWRGLRGRGRGEGMMARFKFLWQTLIALAVVLLLYYGFGLRSLA
ncbi:MAG: phospho-N-acetylmuramoyl-pentapeptide-transferase, partial [Chloroflexi bacterium]|nr:phospho-N-acetylmuramoyl-pentapeptide-transferase [Chloroflexota bacterium]